MKNTVLLEMLYPNKCAACDEIIDESKVFCDYCNAALGDTDYSGKCKKCGLGKDNCICGTREFRFSGIVSAYVNTGVARKAYYAYKIGRRRELARFFAEKAANAVRSAFGDIEFDSVFSVPAARRSRLKRGFDHGEAIARILADIIGAQYVSGVLKTRHFRPFQHKSKYKERLENVRGKYYTVKNVSAKRVLLFDDIFTTGATLDECTKELMFAGARQVYCVSVLLTQPKKRSDGEKKNGN